MSAGSGSTSATAAQGAAPLEFRLDARMEAKPSEEVLALATEAFGQIAASLSSPKWDRRVAALKGVGTVLKGLDIKVGESADGAQPDGVLRDTSCRGLQLRDRARCFRAACLILHIAMRDKVLPVVFAAHELYRLAFEPGLGSVVEDEANHAMGTLVQHLLAKLGELNIRLHESACAGVVFSAERPFFGLALTLSRLKAHIEERCGSGGGLPGQHRMRVHAGTLDVVGQLLRRFPGRRSGDKAAAAEQTWTAQDVAPFISCGLAVDGVTGSRVQQAAAGLAIQVCNSLGRGALDPLLESLPAASKDLLMLRLKDEALDGEEGESDGDEGVELVGEENLCVMGIGLRPPQPRGVTNQHEESIMDKILEETGLVFGGQGLAAKAKDGSALEDEDLRGLGLV